MARVLGAPDSPNRSESHYLDPIRVFEDKLEVVTDKDYPLAAQPQLFKNLANLLTLANAESCRRFVQENDRTITENSARDRHRLPLTTRQLADSGFGQTAF